MRSWPIALLLLAACTPSGRAEPMDAAPARVDAGVDLVALQVSLGQRVVRAERALAAAPARAPHEAAVAAGLAAKLQIAALETPAAAPALAEAQVAAFERAVALGASP